jgi:hypothetical protein
MKDEARTTENALKNDDLGPVAEVLLQCWNTYDAPEHLRSLAPGAEPDGWVALIHRGGTEEFLEKLLGRCRSRGILLEAHRCEDGCVVLTGPRIMGFRPPGL